MEKGNWLIPFFMKFRKTVYVSRISEITCGHRNFLIRQISNEHFEIIRAEIGNHTPYEPPIFAPSGNYASEAHCTFLTRGVYSGCGIIATVLSVRMYVSPKFIF